MTTVTPRGDGKHKSPKSHSDQSRSMGMPYSGAAYHGIWTLSQGLPNSDDKRFPPIPHRDRAAHRTHGHPRRIVVGCAKSDWTRAHESAQQDEGRDDSWVHAYLHRKEGDDANATYWYGRSGKPVCRESVDAECVSMNLLKCSKAGKVRTDDTKASRHELQNLRNIAEV